MSGFIPCLGMFSLAALSRYSGMPQGWEIEFGWQGPDKYTKLMLCFILRRQRRQ